VSLRAQFVVITIKDVMFLPLYVYMFVCEQDNSKKLVNEFDENFWRCVMCDWQQLIRFWW